MHMGYAFLGIAAMSVRGRSHNDGSRFNRSPSLHALHYGSPSDTDVRDGRNGRAGAEGSVLAAFFVCAMMAVSVCPGQD